MKLIQSVIQAMQKRKNNSGKIRPSFEESSTLKFNKGIFSALSKMSDLKPQFGLSDHASVAFDALRSANHNFKRLFAIMPLNLNQPLIIINCVPRDVMLFSHTRGIGPNQSEPAFDIFEKELVCLGVDIKIYHYEDP